MAVNPSQIRSWIRAARERAGLTQEKAAQRAGVGLGVVTNSEHKGSMMAENFLTLVIAYGAEDALVNQLREWRTASGEAQAGQAVAPSGAPVVNQSDDYPPIATGYLGISPQDQADLEAHEAARRPRRQKNKARPPSAPAGGSASRSPAKPGSRGGKGRGP